MSLINDALKKAQNLQARPAGATSLFPRPNLPVEATSAAPVVTDLVPAPSTPAATLPLRQGKSPNSALIITIASTVLLAGVGAIGYVVYALFFMGAPAEETAAAAPMPAVVKSAATPAAATPTAAEAVEPDAPVPAPATPAATSTQEFAAALVAVASPAPVPTPASAPAVATPTVSATPPPVPAAAPAAVAEEEEIEERINHPKPHIQAWVDKITVSGIRPGDTPKALMNDRVFVVGDVVNRELGLHLLKVSDRLLVFEDNEGNTYDYTF